MRKEILRTGKFTDMNAQEVVVKKSTLTNLVNNFDSKTEKNSDGNYVPLTIGHPWSGGAPAVAWVGKLEVLGNKLFAEFCKITEEAKKLIENFEFRNVSSGFKMGDNEILHHVALTNFPAVSGLNDFQLAQFEGVGKENITCLTYKEPENDDETLLRKFTNKIISVFEQTKGEKNMAENQEEKLAQLEERINSAAEKITTLESGLAAAQEQNKADSATIAQLNQQIADMEEFALDQADEAFLSAQVGNIYPHEKTYALTVMKSLRGQPNVKLSVKKKDGTTEIQEMSAVEAYKNSIAARPKISELENIQINDGVNRKDSTAELEAGLEAYMKQHPEMSYGRALVAYDAILKQEGKNGF